MSGKLSPAQRVMLDSAARGPVTPTARAARVAAALAARGWIWREPDGSYAITVLGREAHALAFRPLEHSDHIVKNWERARSEIKARVANVR